MSKIVPPDSISCMLKKPEKKSRRPLEPSMFSRVEGDEWAVYVSIHKEGEFRRITFPLATAMEWLTWNVDQIIEAQRPRETKDANKDSE